MFLIVNKSKSFTESQEERVGEDLLLIIYQALCKYNT